MVRFSALVFALALGAATNAAAQGAQVAFGASNYDRTAPVEVTADALSVNQSDGSAVFEGNVLVGQGELRLSAEALTIEYVSEEGSSRTEVSRIVATGGVTLVSGEEAAEAQEAVYTLADSRIVMSGDVVVTQGPNALSGDRLVVDLVTGAGRVEGQVRTVIRTTAE